MRSKSTKKPDHIITEIKKTIQRHKKTTIAKMQKVQENLCNDAIWPLHFKLDK